MSNRAKCAKLTTTRDQRSVEIADTMTQWELRLGRWQDVLRDVRDVDTIIVDPPYSARTHNGHDAGANMANRNGGWRRDDGSVDAFRVRRELSYQAWGKDDIEEFVASWAPRCRGWFVAFSDSDLCMEWRSAYERHGLTGFQPVAVMIPGMTVRMSGDGPSSWTVYLNVSRPKSLNRWGTLPGGYHGGQGEREHIGGKPEWLMRAIVRDYSHPGDLVCDPCAGGATTILAAAIESRNSIGAEVDPETHKAAIERMRKAYTPDMFSLGGQSKQCGNCGGFFVLEFFGKDNSTHTGRQSWCRRCKEEWEQGPENTWKRLRAHLEKYEPGSIGKPNGWTADLFLTEWKRVGGCCELAGVWPLPRPHQQRLATHSRQLPFPVLAVQSGKEQRKHTC
jgi:hypothetical protein